MGLFSLKSVLILHIKNISLFENETLINVLQTFMHGQKKIFCKDKIQIKKFNNSLNGFDLKRERSRILVIRKIKSYKCEST